MTALRDAGIPYEIVPGVASPLAAAAAAGIPLTRRLTARRVQFITGHDADGRLPSDLDLKSLADSSACTVIFMGKRTFPALAEALMAEGLPGTTPALLAESVGTAEQSLLRSSVADLAARLAKTIGAKPALIVYGPLAEGDGHD